MTSWNESQIIDTIQSIFPTRDDLVSRGIGDDCAVIRIPHELVTTDAAVSHVHFDLSWMHASDAAYRCLTANISDIAAMGGIPGPFTLALGLPQALPKRHEHRPLNPLQLEDIAGAIAALRTCIEDHGLTECWLIGGDVVRSPELMFSITMFGRCDGHAPVMRNGAHPGDAVVVLGSPGMSHIGLGLCLKGLSYTNDTRLLPFLDAFKRPRALPYLARAIARESLATAMMDLSDGIRTDLPRLLAQSRCGARINIDALVPSEYMRYAAQLSQLDPVSAMLCGGEDFGLLLTCPPQNLHDISYLAEQNHTECRCIGTCTDGPLEWTETDTPSDRTDISFTHFG